MPAKAGIQVTFKDDKNSFFVVASLRSNSVSGQ
jgi:hypothetical protein